MFSLHLRLSQVFLIPLALLLFAATNLLATDTVLIPTGSIWKYLDNGSDQGTAWTAAGFNDSAWASGPAQLGYGDGDEATVVGFGPNSSSKYITTYFRRLFSVADAAAYKSLKLRLLRDDGAVVYLNGIEIYRSNMPPETITYTTTASSALGSPAESTFVSASLGSGCLLTGTNILAVEVHQDSGTSSDISFDFELIASSLSAVTRGPYLQMVSPTGIHVRWRTSSPENSRVSYGQNASNLTMQVDDPILTTEHEIVLQGLTPDTLYFYSVGTTTDDLAGGIDYLFYTVPAVGTEVPVRIWATGDLGTGTANAAAVRDAYAAFTNTRYTDVWLTLGDNDQKNGFDWQYQTKFFDMYADLLKQTAVWPTLGNHDADNISNPPPDIAYYQIFSLPDKGESGGLASGTESYYSFDFANIHFVSLDSFTSDRSSAGPMLNWLAQDLAQNTLPWTIAYWHHPPYTKGTYDSDTQTQLIEMRQNALPILEDYGVDLVLSGHSHVYERSFLIDNHYGFSGSFTPSMKVDGGSGRDPAPYTKPKAPHAGTVYVVAGTAGTTGSGTLNHPAMYFSLGSTLGSMVLDINGNRLDAKYLNSNGVIVDSFSIVKNLTPNGAPSVAITGPVNGAVFTQPASIPIQASASDSDGTIAKVAFYAGSTKIGEATNAPYSISWTNAPAGSHTLTAVATDNLGASTTSTAVSITVNPSNNSAPSVAITSPVNGAVFTQPSSIPIEASASDSDGTITKVAFYAGSTKIGEATNAPYSISWTNAPAGSHTLTAIATDNLGASATSTAVNITVNPPPDAPNPPSGLRATAPRREIRLYWTQSTSSGVTKNRIYRAIQNGGPYSLLGTAPANTKYEDNNVTSGITYYYVVTAINGSGTESSYSNQAFATAK